MATTSTPTKPLLTARFSLVNTTAYSPSEIQTLFSPALKKAGFAIYQTPAVKSYTAKYTLTKEGPFPDDDTKAIFETMLIKGPSGKDIAIAKDIANDPKGSRPILELRKPVVTTFAWNLSPSSASITPQSLADLLWEIRRQTVYDKSKYLGIGWTPIVSSWATTPASFPPYPDRPPIPAALLPKKPAIKPVIKPVITPVIKPKPDPIIVPVISPKPFYQSWKFWLFIAGSYGTYNLLSPKRAHK